MASGMTQFCWNLLLEKLLRGTAGTFPGTFYMGLGTGGFSDTAQTGETTSGNIGGYARQALTVATGTWAALSAGSTSNSAIINWGTASSGAGVSLTQWGIFDASTSGNLFLWADLTTSQTVANGNPYSIAIGAAVVGGI